MTGSTATGTYFRLIFPGRKTQSGRFFENAGSRCSDRSYTVLTAGRQGGLMSGAFQPGQRPAFTRKGDAAANAIVRPVSFTGINLSLSTSPTDPQTRRQVPPPKIYDSRGRLTGQLQALSIAWDGIFINQGSPKPGGLLTGATLPVTGTYSAITHKFVLTWMSQIVGGRFNGFTGYWHLAGTFKAEPGNSSPGTPKTHTTRKTATISPLRKDVDLINCGVSPGGWSAGGVVTNPSRHATNYNITVRFIAESSRNLGSGTTTVPLAAGQSKLWSAHATFVAPSHVGCVLNTVSTG